MRKGKEYGVLQNANRYNRDLFLRIHFRIPANNPVVRFRHELIGTGNHKITKTGGADYT